MTEVVLRAVTEDDFAVLYALDVEEASRVGRSRPIEEKRRTYWFGSAGPYERKKILASIDGAVVGAGLAYLLPGTCAVSGYTSAEHRGRGVGTALLEWQLDVARSTPEITHVSATAYMEDDAPSLLEANGFDVTATPSWEMKADAKIADQDGPAMIEAADLGTGAFPDRYRDIFANTFGEETLPDAQVLHDADFDDFCLYGAVDGVTVGFCHGMLRKSSGHGDVLFLGVRESHRRTGIGRQLLRAGGNELISRGATTLGLNVEVANESALELYRSEGYELVAVIRSYGLDLI